MSLLLACALLQVVPNGNFETGTLEGCTLIEGTAGACVDHVGSVPPPEGGNMALLQQDQAGGGVGGGVGGGAEQAVVIGIFTALVFIDTPGQYTVSAMTRVLADTMPASDLTLAMDVQGFGQVVQTVPPAAFEPMAIPDSIFTVATGVIVLTVPINVLEPMAVTISITLTKPADEVAEAALIVDDITVEPTEPPPAAAFDPCVAHTGRGFEPFQNPARVGCCATVAGRRIGPTLPSSILAPRMVDPQDGSIDGVSVPLHTGSLTFNTFT